MANHGFITSRSYFKKDQVLKDLQEINERRFKGLLTIEDSDWSDQGSWFVGYYFEDSEYPEGFNIWIASPKKLEHRHSRTWAYYLEIVFANELALKYNGTLSDEGHGDRWKPDSEKYLTYKSWLDTRYGHIKESHPDSYKTMFDISMEDCPEELKDY